MAKNEKNLIFLKMLIFKKLKKNRDFWGYLKKKHPPFLRKTNTRVFLEKLISILYFQHTKKFAFLSSFLIYNNIFMFVMFLLWKLGKTQIKGNTPGCVMKNNIQHPFFYFKFRFSIKNYSETVFRHHPLYNSQSLKNWDKVQKSSNP